MTDSHELAARWFMARKGYPGARPTSVDKLDDHPCWYFVYHLDGDVLELEVEWTGSDWSTRVTTFSPAP